MAIVASHRAPARAQAPGETAPIVPQLAAQPEPVEQKSEATAVTISVGATLGGIVALSAAHESPTVALGGVGLLLIGPSMGRWYAGSSGGGSLALRGAAGVSMILGISMLFAEDDFDCLDETTEQCNQAQQDHDRRGDVAAVLLFGGAATWVTTSIYDMVMAGHDARMYNREHAMHLAPMVGTVSGHRTTGLVLEGRF